MTETFRRAVEDRKILIREGKIVVGLGEAAAMLGHPVAQLKLWAEQSKVLVVSFTPDLVTFSLGDSASVQGRNLWKEMIQSLERGRTEGNLTKQEYVRLALNFQQGLLSTSDDDNRIVQLVLSVLWKQLTPAYQKILDPISPDKVWPSMGIVG